MILWSNVLSAIVNNKIPEYYYQRDGTSKTSRFIDKMLCRIDVMCQVPFHALFHAPFF